MIYRKLPMVSNPKADLYQMFPIPLYVTTYEGDTTEIVKLEELFYIPIKMKFLEQGTDVQFKNSIEKSRGFIDKKSMEDYNQFIDNETHF